MSSHLPLHVNASRPLVLQNQTCPYCGNSLSRRVRTKEHVIGRRFVPRGALNQYWNLILWACHRCNRQKSDLEDDISAITMHFHTAGLHGMNDAVIQKEALRKGAKSVSRHTRKPVVESSTSLRVRASLGPSVELTGSFTAPPQLEDNRAYDLARLQMTAFFYFLTYDPNSNLGHWWRGGFYPIHGTIKSDWGNPLHRAFMKETIDWDYRLIVTTASGYYRAVIRRHPSAECWSWAVEWNDCYRLVGFLGEVEPAKVIAAGFPALPVHSVAEAPNRWLRYRAEEPLPEHEDTLFYVPTETGA